MSVTSATFSRTVRLEIRCRTGTQSLRVTAIGCKLALVRLRQIVVAPESLAAGGGVEATRILSRVDLPLPDGPAVQ